MNNQYTKLVLLIGIFLVVWGLVGNKISSLVNPNIPTVTVDVMELPVPTDEVIKKEAEDVVDILKLSGGSKNDFKKLRDLSIDLARLIQLDGEDLVVKNTEEIRQANSIAGVMLKLDIKGKYQNLSKAAQEVIIASIGDDNIPLTPDLRTKAVDGFNALAWAYNEAAK